MQRETRLDVCKNFIDETISILSLYAEGDSNIQNVLNNPNISILSLYAEGDMRSMNC